MNHYAQYLDEIDVRSGNGLSPLPIVGKHLTEALVAQIKDQSHQHREESLHYFIYNVLPGTTEAASVKSAFLKEIILGHATVDEISPDFAFEQLSHMKGGPSVEALIDLAFNQENSIAEKAAQILKNQVFLYEADMDRLQEAYNA